MTSPEEPFVRLVRIATAVARKVHNSEERVHWPLSTLRQGLPSRDRDAFIPAMALAIAHGLLELSTDEEHLLAGGRRPDADTRITSARLRVELKAALDSNSDVPLD
jgi:hypothetical protein